MHYKQQIVIDRPVDQVVELFEDTEKMKKWFPGFVGFEHLSGEPGQPGAKSKMTFKTKRGDFEMIETIIVRNLPDEMSATYDTVGKPFFNTMTNRFIPVGEGSTRYETEVDYKVMGFGWKVMSLFMGVLIRRESFKPMKRFKEFAESQPVRSRASEPA